MSAATPEPRDGLLAAVTTACREAARLGRPRFVVLRERASAGEALAFAGLDEGEEGFYFERPDEGEALASRGAVAELSASGAGRFGEAARRARALFAELRVVGPPAPAWAGPLLVGGFAFADAERPAPEWAGFPAGRLVLPRALLVRRAGALWCSVARAVGPSAEPRHEAVVLCEAWRSAVDAAARSPRGHALRAGVLAALEPDFPSVRGPDVPSVERPAALDEFRRRVAEALQAVRAGRLEKLVVARSIALARAAGFAPAPLLARLRLAYPTCTSFAVAHPGGCDGTFLGASPERLLRVEGRSLRSAAVAGTCPRGRSPAEDERLGRALLESKKEQGEHAAVVRALREGLTESSAELRVPEAPRLLRLGGLQHLETPLEGTLREGIGLLDLVARLHPTPAVGGAPRRAALEWIAQHEGLARGWYGGPLGFVDAEGGGEFCVALRSGLLRGSEARLYAGAGVVAESNPEAELAETRLKLRALLDPLRES